MFKSFSKTSKHTYQFALAQDGNAVALQFPGARQFHAEWHARQDRNDRKQDGTHEMIRDPLGSRPLRHVQ